MKQFNILHIKMDIQEFNTKNLYLFISKLVQNKNNSFKKTNKLYI